MFNWLFLSIAFYPKDKAAIKMTNTQNRKDVDNINIATRYCFLLCLLAVMNLIHTMVYANNFS